MKIRIIIIIFFFTSCNVHETKTVVAGKISMPTDSILLFFKALSRDDADTVKINSNNEFKWETDIDKPVLYNFKYGNYIGHFYMKPNDSITIYFNALYFDETIHYAGDEAIFNNLLASLLLQDKKMLEDVGDVEFYENPSDLKTIVASYAEVKEKIFADIVSEYKNLLRDNNKKRIIRDYLHIWDMIIYEKYRFYKDESFRYSLNYTPDWSSEQPNYYQALLGTYYFATRTKKPDFDTPEELESYMLNIKDKVKNKSLYDVIVYFMLRELFFKNKFPGLSTSDFYLFNMEQLKKIFISDIQLKRFQEVSTLYENLILNQNFYPVSVQDTLLKTISLTQILSKHSRNILIPWGTQLFKHPEKIKIIKNLINKYGNQIILLKVSFSPDYLEWFSEIKNNGLNKTRNYFVEYDYRIPYLQTDKNLVYLIDDSLHIHQILFLNNPDLIKRIEAFLEE